ncbi:MAG TPA: TerB family tellurite resistance protein [Segetibacter sp.]|nr:TerB family tellurite resistance protein [Segetibacter sp.]
MGLFDTILNNVPEEKTYTPEDVREAYAVVLYCCANAEGNIGDEEVVFIDSLFLTMSIFEGYDGADYLQAAEKVCKNFTLDELLEGSFKLVKEEQHSQLFCYCCDVFLADGVVTEEEKKIMEKIAILAKIDEETSKKIVEVALIRNVKDS